MVVESPQKLFLGGGTTSQNLLVVVEAIRSFLQLRIHISKPSYGDKTIPEALSGGGTTSENLLVVAEPIRNPLRWRTQPSGPPYGGGTTAKTLYGGGTTSRNLLVVVKPIQSSLQRWIRASRPSYGGGTTPKILSRWRNHLSEPSRAGRAHPQFSTTMDSHLKIFLWWRNHPKTSF